MGVKLIDLSGGDRVVSVAKLAQLANLGDRDEEPGGDGPGPGEPGE